jgi:hypothetical protein
LPTDASIRTSDAPKARSLDLARARRDGASIEGDTVAVATSISKSSKKHQDIPMSPKRSKMRTWWREFLMGAPRE